uniref:polyribonucleotide nucleotidyltransferase n=1 Tax=Panagrellus redivivus TaxID=6233 RepID=A0A7E4VRV7_PANRE
MLRRPLLAASCPPRRIRSLATATFPTQQSATVTVGEAEVTFRSGHMARFADGAVTAETADSAVLATVVSKPKSNGGTPTDFLSLNVDYKQSAAAVGRIPTTYLRREMQQSDADIIASRIIDRSIRPLIADGYTGTTQILCKPMALDETADGVVLGLNAASAALAVSTVPMRAKVAAVRVGIVDGQITVNPPMNAFTQSPLNLLVSGSREKRLVMLEMEGDQIRTEIFLESIERAFTQVDKLLDLFDDFESNSDKEKTPIDSAYAEAAAPIKEAMLDLVNDPLTYILLDPTHDKTSRDVAINELRKSVVDSLYDKEGTTSQSMLNTVFADHVKSTLRRLTLDLGQRCDGRQHTEFRPISIQTDVYKRLHGSAIFQRGQSQVMGTVTFDSPAAAFHPDSVAQLLGAQQKKMFMLHYEFPAFATNELSTSSRPFNRRELGHGILAEKSLKYVVPDDFPYCVRLACQVLESNGSTSMASACVGSLAMYDAGVPLKAPVAGVAIGMVSNDEGKYAVLTDLAGIEDYAGDMDFKMAGTARGFTAMQLDLKTLGLTPDQLRDALVAGRGGLDHVLGKMNEAIDKPRAEFKPTVPIIATMPVPAHKRNVLFRGAAYNAKLIEAETGVRVYVEDDESVGLLAPNKDKLAAAKKMIETLIEENTSLDLIFGTVYKCEIAELAENGIYVRVRPGTRPVFIPNRNLDTRRVAHASALGFKQGDYVHVQYLGRDDASGQHRFS